MPQYTSWIAWLIVSSSASATPRSIIQRPISLADESCIAASRDSSVDILVLLRSGPDVVVPAKDVGRVPRTLDRPEPLELAGAEIVARSVPSSKTSLT